VEILFEAVTADIDATSLLPSQTVHSTHDDISMLLPADDRPSQRSPPRPHNALTNDIGDAVDDNDKSNTNAGAVDDNDNSNANAGARDDNGDDDDYDPMMHSHSNSNADANTDAKDVDFGQDQEHNNNNDYDDGVMYQPVQPGILTSPDNQGRCMYIDTSVDIEIPAHPMHWDVSAGYTKDICNWFY
jgi:hypothetical protein